MTEIEKAIKIITYHARRAKKEAHSAFASLGSCGTEHLFATADAFDLAIQALEEKAERDNPKPLTLDELRQMEWEPVWITKKKPIGWLIYCGSDCDWFMFHNDKMYRGCNYGKSWLAYRYKPKEG